MSVTVREATGADLEAILDVAEAAWYAAYGATLDSSTIAAALDEYYAPDLVEGAIEHDAIVFHVADIDGEVVGFASAEQTWADEVELHALYVHPDRWGEGIGSALLDRIVAWAREQDGDRIACGVLADNAVGTGFFEAVGFTSEAESEAEIAGSSRAEREYELDL
jgi:N-acetylglutamate synthase-like GNAT family acetyltransferase